MVAEYTYHFVELFALGIFCAGLVFINWTAQQNMRKHSHNLAMIISA